MCNTVPLLHSTKQEVPETDCGALSERTPLGRSILRTGRKFAGLPWATTAPK